MKRNFITLAIAIVMIFTGMQSADAQMKVTVSWAVSGQCPDTCTSHEVCKYYVEYTIYDLCGQEPVQVCPPDGTFVDCSEFDAYFECDYDCEGATHNPCFFVVARATKFCTGPGGTIAICTGSGQAFAPCLDFIDPGVTVYITWN